MKTTIWPTFDSPIGPDMFTKVPPDLEREYKTIAHHRGPEQADQAMRHDPRLTHLLRPE